jgi:hypothetical protein
VLALVVVGLLIAVASAGASLSADSTGLAKVGLPLGGGHIASVSVVTGPSNRPIPVELRGDVIWPRGRIPAGERVSIEVVVTRPGWVSWLSGASQRVTLSLVTPTAAPLHTYLTLGSGAPLRVSFDQPVSVASYGSAAAGLRRHVLGQPTAQLTLPHRGPAGTLWIAAAPRTWETAQPTAVSWFPTGAATAAVASPAPGAHIGPSTPIALTFSKPVASALGTSRPPVLPMTPGIWHQVSTHTIVFRPTGYGYGLGATVRIGLPAGVKLVGGQSAGASETGVWTVPAGSALRVQQLLATLGYLPLRFSSSSPVAGTPQAQEDAAIHPPQGSFSWRFGSVPSSLSTMWAPGVSGEMTRGP